MALDATPAAAHVTTPSGRVIAIAEGARLVCGRGPDADLVIPAGRGLSRRAGAITALTGGGPAYATRSIAMYIISVGFSDDAYGYASSIAMVLLVLTAVLALSITTVLRRREVSL